MNDPWAVLRRFTQARIGLGRCGSGLPTAALLEFHLAHAQARDALHVPWDLGRFAEEVRGLGVEPVTVESAVSDRGEYLRRPDLGRRLTERSRERPAGLAGLVLCYPRGRLLELYPNRYPQGRRPSYVADAHHTLKLLDT